MKPSLTKGTPVYYHSRNGDTVPAIVAKTEWPIFHPDQKIKINGNFVEGDRNTWVAYKNLTLQEVDK